MKGIKGFVKGVGTGMAAGMAIAAVGSMMMRNNRNMKKTMGKTVKAVGDFVSNVQYMLK